MVDLDLAESYSSGRGPHELVRSKAFRGLGRSCVWGFAVGSIAVPLHCIRIQLHSAIDACDSHNHAAGICRTEPPSQALLADYIRVTCPPESTGTELWAVTKVRSRGNGSKQHPGSSREALSLLCLLLNKRKHYAMPCLVLFVDQFLPVAPLCREWSEVSCVFVHANGQGSAGCRGSSVWMVDWLCSVEEYYLRLAVLPDASTRSGYAEESAPRPRLQLDGLVVLTRGYGGDFGSSI
ncbi:hypothetical protein BBK36DRAFT_1142144 [Trichoderma citrinoviride]|uniref:Uncharacterized protein n=1 Tax=Trichoderma citrinoviride TaxID=58853 RepID=A0A2T4B738_9HYPO|nr:hypothetical protein BBK36DRAFT_1142144 [Trichoderma citrinoviride]PTB65137.1 hypothetical protein BBK36DRAFT_1142144 [Trichoderma citrinoviride]